MFFKKNPEYIPQCLVCDKVATDVVGVVEKLAAVVVIDRPHAVVPFEEIQG
jgi:hypothetical protein